MHRFFAVFAGFCLVLLFAALVGGHSTASMGLPSSGHLLLGMTAGILTLLLQSLVIAIFAGAGKDTRLLTKDLKLDPAHYDRIKQIRNGLYPQTMYCCFLVLATAFVGAGVGQLGWMRYVHLAFAWGTCFYVLRTALLQYRGIRENSQILDAVNNQADALIRRGAEEGRTVPAIEELGGVAYGAHVYAFGRFLIYLSFNVWLPYLYFKFNVGYQELPLWPFALSFVALLLGGFYLRGRYRSFRQQLFQTPIEG